MFLETLKRTPALSLTVGIGAAVIVVGFIGYKIGANPNFRNRMPFRKHREETPSAPASDK